MTSTLGNLVKRGASMVLGAGLLAGIAASASAQSFPSKPMRMVLAFPAGSGTELSYRPVADAMSRVLGQTVLVDARPGGGSMVASLYVKAQPADGYTLYAASNTVTMKSLVKDAQVDIRRDFTPVGLMNVATLVFTVNADQVKATTMKELVDEIRSKPGQLNYGSYGVGSGAHIITEMFLNETKTKMVHVPFQGTAQAALETAAGRIQFNAAFYPTLNPFVTSLGGNGKIRMIAVTIPERSSLIPGVPGMRESGYPDLDSGLWGGVVGPANMPRPIVDTLNRALNEALKDPKVVENFTRIGSLILGGTPEDMAQKTTRQYDAYAKLMRETGIVLE